MALTEQEKNGIRSILQKSIQPNSTPGLSERMQRLQNVVSSQKQQNLSIQPGFISRVGTDIGKRATEFKKDISSNPLNPLTQIKGATDILGGIGDIGNEIVGSLFGIIGKQVSPAIQNWAQQHPEAAQNLKKILQPTVNVGTQVVQTGVKAYESAPAPVQEVLRRSSDVASGLATLQGGKILANISKKAAEVAVKPLAEKILSSTEEQLLELSRPVLSKKAQIKVIQQGKGQAQGLLTPAKIIATERDLKRAKVLEDIIDLKKNKFENINEINKAISNEAESAIKGLEKNNKIFNKKTLNSSLNKIEKPISILSDPRLNKMYDLAQEKFMFFVDKEKKNLAGLLKARKKFDIWIEEQIPKIWDDPSIKPLQKALRDMRKKANKFIIENLPDEETSKIFENSLKKQNLLFEARDNIAEKAIKTELKGGKIPEFIKKHKTFIKGGATALGAGEIIRRL